MHHIIVKILYVFLICSAYNSHAENTRRISEFSNDSVNVWKTTILPHHQNRLTMHHHAFDRVLVALSSGTLKITEHSGEVRYLKLKKNQAYFVEKDAPNAFHQDENIGNRPIEVMVIELKARQQ